MKQTYNELMESLIELIGNKSKKIQVQVNDEMPLEKKPMMIPCTLSCTYDGFGNILYRNEQGQLHNPNEPAVMGTSYRYFLNDVEYSLTEWENEVQKIQRKKQMKEKIEEKNKELLRLIQELETLS